MRDSGSMTRCIGRPAQRGVAGHEAGEGMAGQDAREQAGRGAGVAEIEHVGGLAAAAHAEAADPPDAAGSGPASCIDLGAQRAQRGGGAQHVLALEQAAHGGFAQRQRAEHQGAMGHRFVARRAHAALQAGDGAGDKLGRMGSGGQDSLLQRRRKCDAASSYHAGIWF